MTGADPHQAPTTIERFHATSGQASGWLTLVLACVIAGFGVVYLDEGFPDWVVAAAVLVAVLSWAAMLRPALFVRGAESVDGVLVMRNLFETVEIRLAAVEELAVRQVLAVRAADKRWISPVVGRTWRKALASPRRSETQGPHDKQPYADFVEDRLHLLVSQARDRAGVKPGSPEQLALPDAVRRTPALLPIALMAAATVALVLTILF